MEVGPTREGLVDGILETALYVDDLGRAAAFYRGLLGPAGCRSLPLMPSRARSASLVSFTPSVGGFPRLWREKRCSQALPGLQAESRGCGR